MEKRDKYWENKGWQAMSELLDEQMPQARRKRRGAFWWFLGTALLVLGGYALWPRAATVPQNTAPLLAETERPSPEGQARPPSEASAEKTTNPWVRPNSKATGAGAESQAEPPRERPGVGAPPKGKNHADKAVEPPRPGATEVRLEKVAAEGEPKSDLPNGPEDAYLPDSDNIPSAGRFKEGASAAAHVKHGVDAAPDLPAHSQSIAPLRRDWPRLALPLAESGAALSPKPPQGIRETQADKRNPGWQRKALRWTWDLEAGGVFFHRREMGWTVGAGLSRSGAKQRFRLGLNYIATYYRQPAGDGAENHSLDELSPNASLGEQFNYSYQRLGPGPFERQYLRAALEYGRPLWRQLWWQAGLAATYQWGGVGQVVDAASGLFGSGTSYGEPYDYQITPRFDAQASLGLAYRFSPHWVLRSQFSHGLRQQRLSVAEPPVQQDIQGYAARLRWWTMTVAYRFP